MIEGEVVAVAEDGSILVTEGNPDIGGSRASMAIMAAETLGIAYEKVRVIVADTSSIGFSMGTGGTRTTFATGMAVTQAAEKVVEQLKSRAAAIWDISPEAVEWKDGKAFPAGANAGSFEPLSLADIAVKSGRTGGPITAEVSIPSLLACSMRRVPVWSSPATAARAGRMPSWASATAWFAPLPPSISLRRRTRPDCPAAGTWSTTSTKSLASWPNTTTLGFMPLSTCPGTKHARHCVRHGRAGSRL